MKSSEKIERRKHKNYELLNLLGYGLAKFNDSFVKQFGHNSKTSFYKYLIDIGVCETVGTIKNRQDMLDPFFDNGRKGWWQKKEQYKSRKLVIDSLFGSEDVSHFAKIVKLYLCRDFDVGSKSPVIISPVLKSKFQQLQETGREAEMYFLNNFELVEDFRGGIIEDARLFGDGYDFQIENNSKFYLAEIKGIKKASGSIRLTQNEYNKALEYNNDYQLVVISNIIKSPKIIVIQNPVDSLKLTQHSILTTQINYHSEFLKW